MWWELDIWKASVYNVEVEKIGFITFDKENSLLSTAKNLPFANSTDLWPWSWYRPSEKNQNNCPWLKRRFLLYENVKLWKSSAMCWNLRIWKTSAYNDKFEKSDWLILVPKKDWQNLWVCGPGVEFWVLTLEMILTSALNPQKMSLLT